MGLGGIESGGCGMGDNFWNASSQSSSNPLHTLSAMGTLGWLGHVGKDAQTLESKKTKYLAMSPVTDNYEKMDKELMEDLKILVS